MAYTLYHVQIVENNVWDKLIELLGPDLKNIFSLIYIKMKIPNFRSIIKRVIILLGPQRMTLKYWKLSGKVYECFGKILCVERNPFKQPTEWWGFLGHNNIFESVIQYDYTSYRFVTFLLPSCSSSVVFRLPNVIQPVCHTRYVPLLYIKYVSNILLGIIFDL